MHMSWYSNPQLQQVDQSQNVEVCSVNVEVTEQNSIVGYVNVAVKPHSGLWQSLYFQI
jgi:hypothetical protein